MKILKEETEKLYGQQTQYVQEYSKDGINKIYENFITETYKKVTGENINVSVKDAKIIEAQKVLYNLFLEKGYIINLASSVLDTYTEGSGKNKYVSIEVRKIKEKKQFDISNLYSETEKGRAFMKDVPKEAPYITVDDPPIIPEFEKYYFDQIISTKSKDIDPSIYLGYTTSNGDIAIVPKAIKEMVGNFSEQSVLLDEIGHFITNSYLFQKVITPKQTKIANSAMVKHSSSIEDVPMSYNDIDEAFSLLTSMKYGGLDIKTVLEDLKETNKIHHYQKPIFLLLTECSHYLQSNAYPHEVSLASSGEAGRYLLNNIHSISQKKDSNGLRYWDEMLQAVEVRVLAELGKIRDTIETALETENTK